MPKLMCPVCGKELFRGKTNRYCENGHNYDISRFGYVNLLMASGKGRHGDDRLMVRARKEFLDKGYYDRLSELISELVVRYIPDGGDIIDAGCGECKYTYDILKALEKSEKSVSIAGIDISKEALAVGGRRSMDIDLAVASARKLPFCDKSADVILSIFAPFETGEFSRVLKNDGCVIRAFPLERHLIELKELIYDKPYLNKASSMEEEGFVITDRYELKYSVEIENGADIENLFKMTPYYYKTSEEDQKKLKNASYLKTSLEFGVIVYQKKEELK